MSQTLLTSRAPAALALALTLLAAGCRSTPPPARRPPLHAATHLSHEPRVARPPSVLQEPRNAAALPVQGRREWLSFGAGLMSRGGSSGDLFEDGLGWSVDGGYVLGGRRFRTSLELGGTYSEHDIDTPPRDDGDLDLYRISAGFRIELDLPRAPLTPYVRGGWFYRFSDDDEFEAEPFDQDGDGVYVGGGLLYWVQSYLAIGPFVVHYEGVDEDDLEETFVGLQALFRHSGSLSDITGRPYDYW